MIFGSVLRDDRPLVARRAWILFTRQCVQKEKKFSGSYYTVPENLGRTRPASYVKSDDRS